MTNLRLAYSHLNLRWNPFGTVDFDDVALLAVVQVDQYVQRLNRPGYALQFLGDCGRGKTTHLLALHDFFSQSPYIHFVEGAPIPEIPQAPLLFLDETQRLPRSLRKFIFSRPGVSFVIATHFDHSSEFKKASLDHDSLVLKGLSVTRLAQIVQRRIEWARRSPGPVPSVPDSEIAKLIGLYGDDLGAILSRLYTEFQELKEVSHVQLSDED